MKKTPFLLIIIFLILSCNDSDRDEQKAGDESSIRGAYSMTSQTGNSGSGDTLLKKEQLKIFSDRFMMYAAPRATDSFGEYGIATYKQEGNKVHEFIFYTSSQGEVRDTAELEITTRPDGFRQVIRYEDSTGTFLLTEDYDRVGKEPRTSLDGAWRQVRDIVINAQGDTVTNQRKTQFKIYESGYFIWANPIKDPASNNFYSAYGYGTFKMPDKNHSQETNINSTFYTSLVGKPVDIAIEYTGEDAYKQTIVQDDGNKSVELYERLK